ncbi:MAG: PQQ-dependent sugar dehydrogenase [Pseudomonadota bacterium]
MPKTKIFFASLFALAASQASASTFVPDAVLNSNLKVQLKPVATLERAPGETGRRNVEAPVTIGDSIYVIDSETQSLNRAMIQGGKKTNTMVTSSGFTAVFDASDLPPELGPTVFKNIRNITASPDGSSIYMTFLTDAQPYNNIPTRVLPDPIIEECCNTPRIVNLYEVNETVGTDFHIIVEYDLNNGVPDASTGKPIVALEMQTGSQAHSSGGMLTLPDGRLLVATGDAVPAGTDGRGGPQNDDEHVGKLLIIDPTKTDPADIVTVAGKGIRNVQSLFYTDQTKTQIAFSDIGNATAEEVNIVSVADLIDTTEIENFGWGRGSDGLAREGTIYIEPGVALRPSEAGIGIGEAPVPEPGFIQPFAQFGREGGGNLAISGPLISDYSFDSLTSLFGNLVNGDLFGTIDPLSGSVVPVYRVGVVDENGMDSTLRDIAGIGSRGDPRFFTFPDGTGGVLLERPGTVYSIHQVPTAVPLPAGLSLLGAALVALGSRRKWRRM